MNQIFTAPTIEFARVPEKAIKRLQEAHPGSKAFFRVLAEVDQDPTHIFWG
jgi:hypothetical protein